MLAGKDKSNVIRLSSGLATANRSPVASTMATSRDLPSATSKPAEGPGLNNRPWPVPDIIGARICKQMIRAADDITAHYERRAIARDADRGNSGWIDKP